MCENKEIEDFMLTDEEMQRIILLDREKVCLTGGKHLILSCYVERVTSIQLLGHRV